MNGQFNLVYRETTTADAVSYTHLDVYKRQVWDRIKLLDSLTAGCDMATWEGPPRASEDAFFINGSAEVFFGGCVANRGFALHGEEWDPGMTGILEREGLELDLRERGVRGDASLREGLSLIHI